MTDTRVTAVNVQDVEARTGTTYPKPFGAEVETRSKRVLGDLFGLTNYGVNLVELPPGVWSSQRHWHTREDEFIYVLSGELTLVTDEGEQLLTTDMVAGFAAGESNGHHLVNKGDTTASYLEIGDRIDEDEVFYPDIDLQLVSDGAGQRTFTHRDGRRYERD